MTSLPHFNTHTHKTNLQKYCVQLEYEYRFSTTNTSETHARKRFIVKICCTTKSPLIVLTRVCLRLNGVSFVCVSDMERCLDGWRTPLRDAFTTPYEHFIRTNSSTSNHVDAFICGRNPKWRLRSIQFNIFGWVHSLCQPEHIFSYVCGSPCTNITDFYPAAKMQTTPKESNTDQIINRFRWCDWRRVCLCCVSCVLRACVCVSVFCAHACDSESWNLARVSAGDHCSENWYKFTFIVNCWVWVFVCGFRCCGIYGGAYAVCLG